MELPVFIALLLLTVSILALLVRVNALYDLIRHERQRVDQLQKRIDQPQLCSEKDSTAPSSTSPGR